MGTPAYSNGHVIVDTVANACLVESALREWQTLAMNKRLPEIDGQESRNGDYGLSGISRDQENITFLVESSRYQNCIWQCENIRNFLKTQPGVQSVEMDVITCEVSVVWFKDDE